MRHVTTRVAGLLILLGGVWGGLIPFVGPYFNFVLGPDKSWTWTSGRFWLDVLPGIVTAVGGLMLLFAGPRVSGRIGALLALAAGIWFAIGPDISQFWRYGGSQGIAHGSRAVRALESLSFHSGLGVVIAALAAYSLPGVMVRTVTAAAGERVAADRAAPAPASAPQEVGSTTA
jgi:hypothetical protein